MSSYIFRRLIMMAVNLILVTLFLFCLLTAVPGDPSSAILGQNASQQQVDAFRHLHGLDKSLPQQYSSWAGGLLRGNFGHSLRTNYSVTSEFFQRLPVTLEVVL